MERRHSEQKMEGNCTIIGLELNEIGKKLLNWTLNVIAKPGDRIVAVHVCKKSKSSIPNTMTLISVLDEFLAQYETLCTDKKIIVVGRVITGKSIQKVLVNEAKLCAAMTMVVGVNKTYSIGGSSSLAKYCAKKLPPTTTIIAVQKGNIIFQRVSPKTPQGGEPLPVLRTVLHPNVGMDPKIIIPKPERSLSNISKARTEESSERNNSAIHNKEEKQRLGWPLLRSSSDLNSPKYDARKMSVVQWAMNLPKRSLQINVNEPFYELIKELKKITEEKDSNSTCKWFSYKDLRSATNNFSPDNWIGKGGSCNVYKGRLENGGEIAVKLSKLSQDSQTDFRHEIEIMSKLNHNYIVPLIGICVEANKLISIYSYLSKGTLEENIHGNKMKSHLDWKMRYNIAIEIASGLNYLHNESDKPVIHRDVKSANILFTDEYTPQLSDFGLAIWAPTDSSSTMSHGDLVGTFGYIAPEYFMYGQISTKIDVYAFGVVLLELLTGRKHISDNQVSLVMWATPILRKGNLNLNELLDPALEGKYDEAEAKRLLLAASLCLIRSARLRPKINQILGVLKGKGMSIDDFQTDCFYPGEIDGQDCETFPATNVNSQLGFLALLEMDDPNSPTSTESSEPSSVEEYLKGRWSRSSSFD
ncbi:hypothetical protein LUZ60_015034 [Juncus effusus]|nr:hypothetical protein LUZ60_015034 [Juncus effusus]